MTPLPRRSVSAGARPCPGRSSSGLTALQGDPPGQRLRSGSYMAAKGSGTTARSAQSECPRFQGNPARHFPPLTLPYQWLVSFWAAFLSSMVGFGAYFTTVEAVAWLSVRSVSTLWLVAVTVLVMVMALVATTLTKIWNWTLAPAPSVARLHLTVPLAPTAGVEHVSPAGGVSDWNCVNGGSGSLITMPEAALGPAFFSVTV